MVVKNRIAAIVLLGLALLSARPAVADDLVPTPWNGMDIGGPSPAGTAKADNGVFTLTGGGELSGSGDRFHFVYQALSGDGALIAHVTAEGNPNDLETAGLMAGRPWPPRPTSSPPR